MLAIKCSIPEGNLEKSPCSLPLMSRNEDCQQSSMLMYSYPASASPESFMARAVSRIKSSSIWRWKVFQLDQPMTGFFCGAAKGAKRAVSMVTRRGTKIFFMAQSGHRPFAFVTKNQSKNKLTHNAQMQIKTIPKTFIFAPK